MESDRVTSLKRDHGGKGLSPLWVQPVKTSNRKVLTLAKSQLSQRECKIFLYIGGGTFLAGLLLSCILFPPQLDNQDSLLYLNRPFIESPLPQLQDQDSEQIEPAVIMESAVLPNPDADLISLLKSEPIPVSYQTVSPAKPAKSPAKENGHWQTVRMRVTGYCACSKCCGHFADGITACNHRIGKGDTFVAADKFYDFGTEMVIPGYNAGRPVKVMDRGKAIKGNRLDLFFHSHKEAQKWGVKYLEVRVKAE